MQSVTHYRAKIRERGILGIIKGRLRWYKQAFQMDNWAIGRLIELSGNRVNLDGVKLSVDNPLILTKHKSTIYFGLYEVAERIFSKKFIDRSLPTIDLGGCIGGVSCGVNKLLKNPSEHVVVECSPALLPTLEANRAINHCSFKIENAAIAYGSDTISFGLGEAMQGSLYRTSSDQVTVPATTLRKLLDKHGFETINLISDCEGAEVAMVNNEVDVMRRHVKWFIAEIHPEYAGREAVETMYSNLQKAGFVERERSRGNVVAFENVGL
jgi:FkbM family methyltransferase